jgi:hypothetical protein
MHFSPEYGPPPNIGALLNPISILGHGYWDGRQP